MHGAAAFHDANTVVGPRDPGTHRARDRQPRFTLELSTTPVLLGLNVFNAARGRPHARPFPWHREPGATKASTLPEMATTETAPRWDLTPIFAGLDDRTFSGSLEGIYASVDRLVALFDERDI